jgi:hypothetical protein
MPYRQQHSCMIDEKATEIVEIRVQETKWGEIGVVMAKKGNKVVVRSLRIPGKVPVSTAQSLCASRGGQFSPATPLNPQAQLMSEEYCFHKLTKDNQIRVLQALVMDFEPPFEEVAMADWSESRKDELPDSAFALILPGGKQDETGRTVPRSLRRLPYKTTRGTIDKVHLTNALARVHQVHAPAGLKRKALRVLLSAAKTVGVDSQGGDKFKVSDLDFYLENLERIGG